jgi:peptidylprolyl isomerase
MLARFTPAAQHSPAGDRYGRRVLRRFAIPAALAGLLVLASCGDVTGSGSSVSATTAAGGSAVPTIVPDVSLVPDTTVPQSTVPHPAVSTPPSIPTTLVSTVIKPGTGPTSKTGDAVIVNYVGARSADAEQEFDNNYGGTPLTVSPLGTAQVIDGLNQGLVGVQGGEELQLDIPNSLAYGDQDQGDVIKAGDALSFVIDVLGVLPATTAANTPDVTVSGAPNRTDLATDDLVVGTGTPVTTGRPVALELVVYRGDTGEKLSSTWDASSPVVFRYGVDSLLPGLVKGIEGMNAGGRRKLTIPFDQAFGEAGQSTLNFPGSVDLVLVVDVVGSY